MEKIVEKKYSGEQSKEFWDFINNSCPEVYLLGCLLQDVECRVFQILATYNTSECPALAPQHPADTL